MIDVELAGGFHDGKPWEVASVADDILMPVIHRRGAEVPGLEMVVYRHAGRLHDGVPVYELAPPPE
ncbi:hypothetical protein [Gordonia liuliyuniae]|uniref:Uncharacterized protein n=1 Tax=Gordonia liuliyuniae TaxID=2911517 RepID=A0ABS9IYC9_9ACTN|nr:hypothetical protein [Gordonia liuliyuniae]MCF8590578.1 hypothetical protein [Gordonia liuliyuniae]